MIRHSFLFLSRTVTLAFLATLALPAVEPRWDPVGRDETRPLEG